MRYAIRKKRICEKCQTEFSPNSPTQLYCGSLEYKTGCSWTERKRRHRLTDLRWQKKKKDYYKSLEEKIKSLESKEG